MSFKLNAYLPSKKQEVLISELHYKQYRDLVKSLHNTDKKETILQYNATLKDLCPDIAGYDITFEDKLSLLLTIRNYCVSPDLKLKCNLQDGTSYSFTVPIETILSKVKSINKSSTVVCNDITVQYSSYKVRDEHVFLSNNRDTFVNLASIIDSLKIEETIVIFKDLTLEARVKVIQELPLIVIKAIVRDIEKTDHLYDTDLLLIKDPNTGSIILRFNCNITFEMLQKMVEFLYTESLNNIYRTLYNVVKYLGFSAEYADSITPIELQVYWMYLMQDNAKQQEQNNAVRPSGGLNMSTSTPNSELGF